MLHAAQLVTVCKQDLAQQEDDVMTEVVNRSPIMGTEQALQTALEMSMMDINNINDVPLDLMYSSYEEEDGSKSLNVTQCVSVPSSEHVAEIVGKQGCKIKALRARTNTYIKTPVRGEEPVFSISGRPDHVSSAKWEIIAAAEHFSQVRAIRPSFPKPPSPLGPGSDKVAIYVRVPYRVVGLVVGQKGATVKRIQQVTKTFIVTPSRDKEPYFEVRGTPENVERARKEIESYIVLRTGNCKDDEMDNLTDLLAQQMQQCQLMDPQYPDASLFSPNGNPSPLGEGLEFPAAKGNMNFDGNCGQVKWKNSVFTGMQFTPPDISYQPMSAPLFTPERSSSLGNRTQPLSPTGSYESNCSDGLGTTSPKQSPLVHRSCCMCKSVVGMATLVPCGHNMFCQTCAHYISCSSGSCPLCSAKVTNVYHM